MSIGDTNATREVFKKRVDFKFVRHTIYIGEVKITSNVSNKEEKINDKII